MKEHTNPAPASDEQVRALLERYACPVAFHEVRTRLLGNIASPAMEVSSMQAVAALWGGELPEFETIDAANELIGTLIAGLWNRLARHQERVAPFRLTRIETTPTREGLARAFWWRKLLETGVFATVGEIAAERINAPYAGRVLRQTLLAPDIVEAILDGRQPVEMTLAALMRPFSPDWNAPTRRFRG